MTAPSAKHQWSHTVRLAVSHDKHMHCTTHSCSAKLDC